MNLMEFNLLEVGLRGRGFDVRRFDGERDFVPQLNLDLQRHQLDVYNADGDYLFDAICQNNSFGSKKGLLEVMNRKMKITKSSDDVEGFLTAEDILRRIDEMRGG